MPSLKATARLQESEPAFVFDQRTVSDPQRLERQRAWRKGSVIINHHQSGWFFSASSQDDRDSNPKRIIFFFFFFVLLPTTGNSLLPSRLFEAFTFRLPFERLRLGYIMDGSLWQRSYAGRNCFWKAVRQQRQQVFVMLRVRVWKTRRAVHAQTLRLLLFTSFVMMRWNEVGGFDGSARSWRANPRLPFDWYFLERAHRFSGIHSVPLHYLYYL